MLESTIFLKLKCTHTLSFERHDYQTSVQYSYQTRQHRAVGFDHFTPQPSNHLFTRLPHLFTNDSTLRRLILV